MASEPPSQLRPAALLDHRHLGGDWPWQIFSVALNLVHLELADGGAVIILDCPQPQIHSSLPNQPFYFASYIQTLPSDYLASSCHPNFDLEDYTGFQHPFDSTFSPHD